jgi:hypothetical protein
VSGKEQQLNREYAAAWRPEAGDQLIGEVVEIGQRNGYDDRPYPIITVRQDDGEELAFHAFHTVAVNELAAAKPQIGERIGIVYRGQKVARDGRTKFHAYRVVMVGRPPETFRWERFGGEPDEQPVESDIPSGIEEFDARAQDDGDLPF